MEGVLGHLHIGNLILLEDGPNLFLVVVMSFESVCGIIESVTSQLEDLSATGMLIKELGQIVIFVADSPVL